MRAVEEAISHILGIPQPLEIENKYLVEILDFDQLKRGARKVNIEQHYLQV